MILENDFLLASFALKGAELQSLKSKKTNLSYIWNGDPVFWAKHSPILFPIIGALKGGTYEYEGQAYKLPRHGFARDHEFEVQQVSNSELVFTLTQTEETLAVYPFEFVLSVRYKISSNNLTCTYEVSNPGQQDLLFSVGGHPAFATPLQDGMAYTDCFLDFNKDEQLTCHKIKANLITDETETIHLTAHQLPLKHELFYEDALVFKDLKSTVISLRNHKNSNGLHFYFRDFPYFGIWAAKDAEFVCLEPWCGIADGVHHDQYLKDKEGIITLAPNMLWERSWGVEVF